MDSLLWALTVLSIIFVGITYVWGGLCGYIIARKTGSPYPWLAWIPVANVVLFCLVAGRSGWWIFIFLVPLVNFVFVGMFFYDIAKKLKMPGWLGALMAVPYVNFVIFGILAFAGQRVTEPAA